MNTLKHAQRLAAVPLTLIAAGLVAGVNPHAGSLEKDGLAQAVAMRPDPRQLAWQEREIEVLIHFGINTMTQKEWGTGHESPAIFNPRRLDAAGWCLAAKSIGAKGLVLVCKHHDGFCLWPSAMTDHSVKSSPWRGGAGDVVKEVSEACRASGLKFGIYLSPADRHEASFGTPKYNELYRAQLRELLTGYGEIAEVWMDGAFPDGKERLLDFPSYYALVRELQPNAVIVSKGPDVRWVGNEAAVAREAEWSVIPLPVPATQYNWPDLRAADLGSRKALQSAAELHWYPAVADMPLNHDWFWDRDSQRGLKELFQLKAAYENSVGRNAGMLLNLCPNNEGVIPPQDRQRLGEFGRWLTQSFATNLIDGITPHQSAKSGGEVEVIYKFPRSQLVNTFVVGEDIRQGQRVESFAVDLSYNNAWTTVATGQIIGWKRIVHWPGKPAEAIRLRITASRAEPVLRTAGVYEVKW